MLAKHPTIYLLGALILGLTLVACDVTPSSPTLPTPTAGAVVTATAAALLPTSTPDLPPAAPPSPTVAAGLSAPTAAQPAAGAAASPTVVAQAPATLAATSAATEQAVAPEQNPAGDIPDTQAFISYSSNVGGYTLDVPEGWARSENGPNVSFVEKLNGETVTITDTATAPTAATARIAQVAALQQTGHAVQVTDVKDVQLPGGPAVLIAYTANSEPNVVTGKQVRLENNAYLFYRNGQLATVTVWAPLGADNVDQWQRIAHSFRWH